jgi:hypothetical protein
MWFRVVNKDPIQYHKYSIMTVGNAGLLMHSYSACTSTWWPGDCIKGSM